MKTLMELVDKCKPFEYSYDKDIEGLFLKAEELKELGFESASKELFDKVNTNQKLENISDTGYLVITPKKIKAYLKLKVARYNKEHNLKSKEERCTSVLYGLPLSVMLDFVPNYETFLEKTLDFWNMNSDTIGKFVWKEQKVKDCKDIPPANILEIMKEHVSRGIYDYFTIASVNAVTDPILLGRVNGSEDRFFIPGCQWGNDIQIDDLV